MDIAAGTGVKGVNPHNKGVRVDPGIYYGRVLNNIDPNRMGQVRVAIYKSGKPGSIGDSNAETIHAIPLNPFAGQTPVSGITQNDQYNRNQTSYGFYNRPPDFGALCVICIVEGTDGGAYLLGYVPDDFMNANVFNNLEAEYNKRVAGSAKNDPDTNTRKLNDTGPFKGNSSKSASIYDNRVKLEKVNGLWADPDRGPQTSGLRRDLNTSGWSTAGPYNYDAPYLSRTLENVGQVVNELPFARHGGTSIVCDDGNPGLFRTSLAKDGKREYVPAPGGEKTIPHSEQFRIETRTGHKIIMHNSEDFISIVHSNGDCWMEFTANGKIDVYSRGGISMATEKDEKACINFHGHQMNIEVDELNISTKDGINIEQRSDPDAEPNFALKVKDGKLDILSTTGLNIQNKVHDGSTVTDDATFKLKHDYENKSLELAAGEIPKSVSANDPFMAFTYNHTEERLEFNSPNFNNTTKVTDTTAEFINSSAESAPLGPFQFTEKPELMHDMPASYEKLDEEKPTIDSNTTMKSVLGRVPRKYPWVHAENYDPEKFMPEKILFGEKPEDAEPVLATPKISYTGIANAEVIRERGGM